MRALVVSLLVAGWVWGCACEADIADGQFRCGAAGECPPDFFCRADGFCHSTPDPGPDALISVDGGGDGGGVDGSGSDGSADDGGGVDGAPEDGCMPRANSVDLLVVVDNSNSMVEEQDLLVDAFPELVRALVTGDVDGDGTPEFVGAPDVHVGVVVPDMGTGGFTVPTCNPPDHGEDGILRTRGNPSIAACDATYPSFLEFMSGGALSAFRQDFQCVGTVGIGGCGMEQQLEAALKAITPSTSATRFFDATRGHGDGANAGFLRDDSVLVVLVVSDEEDCSARDPDLFNQASTMYTESLNLRCPLNPSALHPIARYADGFRALRAGREDLVVFGAIVGIPPAIVDEPYDDILADGDMQYAVDGSGLNIFPACVTSSTFAFPGRRYVTLARELELLGSRASIASICADDYGPAFSSLLGEVSPLLAEECP